MAAIQSSTTQSPNYVANGYVANGYVKGGLNIANAKKEPIQFIVINEKVSDNEILSFIQKEYPDSYDKSITVVFTDKILIAQMVKGVFTINALSGQLSTQDIQNIIDQVPDNLLNNSNFISSLISDISTNTVFTDAMNKYVSNSIISDTSVMTSIAQSVMKMIQINIIAKNGTVITTGLTYDKATNSYVLNYDTSKLDGTGYTINMKLS